MCRRDSQRGRSSISCEFSDAELRESRRCISATRRDFLLAAGSTVTVGFNATLESDAKAAINSSGPRIDAHTHFIPLKSLDFVERQRADRSH